MSLRRAKTKKQFVSEVVEAELSVTTGEMGERDKKYDQCLNSSGLFCCVNKQLSLSERSVRKDVRSSSASLDFLLSS